jgi:hypothetical protein
MNRIPNFFLVNDLTSGNTVDIFDSIYKVDDENFLLMTAGTPITNLGPSYNSFRPAGNFYRLTSSSSDGVPALSHIGCVDTMERCSLINYQNHINGFKDNALIVHLYDGNGNTLRNQTLWVQFDADMQYVINSETQNNYTLPSPGRTNNIGKVLVDPYDPSKKVVIDMFSYTNPGYGAIIEYYENNNLRWRRSIYENGTGGVFDIIGVSSVGFTPNDIILHIDADELYAIRRSNGSQSWHRQFSQSGGLTIRGEWTKSGSYAYAFTGAYFNRISGSSLQYTSTDPIRSGATSTGGNYEETHAKFLTTDPEGNFWMLYNNRVGKYSPSTSKWVGYYEFTEVSGEGYQPKLLGVTTSSDGVIVIGGIYASATNYPAYRLLSKLAFDGSSTMSEHTVGSIAEGSNINEVDETVGITITWTDLDQSASWTTNGYTNKSTINNTGTSWQLQTLMLNAGTTSRGVNFVNSKMLD